METGTDLARRYYDDVVAPLVLGRFPGLPHAAARLGSGSDVLGLDDATSRDHDWGLRLTLLVPGDTVAEIDDLLASALPDTFDGHPTRFGTTWHPEGRHQVEVASAGDFVVSRLGVDATRPLTTADWLGLTGQAVLEITAGPVFTDTDGTLTATRARLAWYPDDVWRYAVAVDWDRLVQELPFVGRTGQRGDDAGSRVVAARMARVVMHLGFLLERRWPPYSKWFGSLFARLPRAGAAMPALERALAAASWEQREDGLCEAVEVVHGLQEQVGLPVAERAVAPFWDRPFRTVAPVSDLVAAAIDDPGVRGLPRGVGTVEQWVDDVAVLVDPVRRRRAVRVVLPVDHGSSHDTVNSG
ncbi:DUF4037 domain-containing protein [Isoptericola hypogeus]|uniref:DUF4037 domain-containing protein n=1 Tax=Isoptericola hypogeus TaxID=300179 RepID=A0ABN2JY71_9MICO